MKPFPRLVLASIAACLAALALASPSVAQLLVGRLTGTVKNLAGQPIKAATVRAVNPSVIPSEFTATADQKGNWAILGMRGGLWEVTASAPGFVSSTVAARVALGTNNPVVQFVLVGTPGKGAMAAHRTLTDQDRAAFVIGAEPGGGLVAAQPVDLDDRPGLDLVQHRDPAAAGAVDVHDDGNGLLSAHRQGIWRLCPRTPIHHEHQWQQRHPFPFGSGPKPLLYRL